MVSIVPGEKDKSKKRGAKRGTSKRLRVESGLRCTTYEVEKRRRTLSD